MINHNKPPAFHIKEIFEAGKCRKCHIPRDAKAILRGKDLSVAIKQCPELKAFINTILSLSKVPVIP